MDNTELDRSLIVPNSALEALQALFDFVCKLGVPSKLATEYRPIHKQVKAALTPTPRKNSNVG